MITLLEPHRWPAHRRGRDRRARRRHLGPLRDILLGLLNRGADSLVVDLRGVTFIDSTGVGSLLRIHHRQGLLGGQVHFVADQQTVLRVLDLMQLTRRLHVTATVAAVARLLPAGPAVDLRPRVALR